MHSLGIKFGYWSFLLRLGTSSQVSCLFFGWSVPLTCSVQSIRGLVSTSFDLGRAFLSEDNADSLVCCLLSMQARP